MLSYVELLPSRSLQSSWDRDDESNLMQSATSFYIAEI